MVSFRWGNQNLSLPESKDFIKSEMKDFIKNTDRNFVVRVKRAIRSTQGSEVNNTELKNQFKAIREEILAEPIKSYLKQDAEGWKLFTQTRVKGLKEPKPNTSNLNYIEEKTLGDITEGELIGRLRGMGAVKYMKGDKVDLPDFNFDEWADNNRMRYISPRTVGHDVTFRESEAENRAGTFNFAHLNSISNYDGHIDAIFPVIDEGDLTSAKADHITEKTGQNATFKSMSGTKQEIAKELVDYSFNIPDEIIDKMKAGGATSSVQEQVLEEGEEGEEDEFEPVGERINLTTDSKEELNMQALLTAQSDLNRTPKMKEENIVQIGDKYYSYQMGDVDVAKKISVDWKVFDEGSPFSFLEDNKDIFMKILNPYFSNPTSVYTAEIVGNIKTNKKPKATFGEKAKQVQAKHAEGKSPDFYEKVSEWKHKKTKETISVEEYNKLPKEEQENYGSVVKPLGAKDIKELTDNAFENIETKETISEKEYNELPSEEKRKYKSKVVVTEEGKSGGVGLETFGGTDYETGSGFMPDEIQEAFNDAYVVCKIYLKKHGEFNLNPFRQGKANRSMATHANKLKKNVRRLRKLLGE